MLLLYKPQRSLIFISLFIIFLGGLLGAFFSEDIATNLSNSAGKIILLFGVWGLSKGIAIYYKRMMPMMDVLMALTFMYWVYYVLGKTLLSGNFISYTTLTFSGRAINHHVVGMQISIAAIYIASRLFSTPGLFRNLSYIILSIAAICCLLTESRSNTAVVLASVLWLIFQERRIKPIYLLISLLLMYYLYAFTMDILIHCKCV